MTIHLTPFYLETGYCHSRVKVRVRASVWVRERFRVWVRVMIGVRMEGKSLVGLNILR